MAPDVAGRTAEEPPSLLWESYFRTQELLLRSRPLLERVLRVLPAPTARDYTAAADPPKSLGDRLDVQPVPSTFLIRVAVVHPSPEQGARIVNTLAEIYLEESNRRLREVKIDALETLSRETLPSLQQKVDEASAALAAFHQETGFVDYEEQYASFLETRRRLSARLTELRLQALQRSSDRASLAAVVESAQTAALPETLLRGRGLEALFAERAALDVERARAGGELKPGHPRLRSIAEQRASVEVRILEALRDGLGQLDRELEASRREATALAEEQARLDGRMADARSRLTQGRRLEEELAAARELYNGYLKKHGETRATSSTGLASVRVVEPAHPPTRPHRKTSTLLTLGLVLGVFLGAVAILVAEQLDDRILAPGADILPGAPVLAVVPRLAKEALRRRGPVVLADDPFSLALEPFRELRSRVLHKLGRQGRGAVVAIAGPRAAEGKSTVAVNLARVLALEGRRVLLFDAELRRPRLKGLLGDSRKAGLEEVLRGDVPFLSGTQRSMLVGIDVLGADQSLRRPAEEAGSDLFRTIVAAARSRYDAVVIDAGPVNLFSEVAGVARQADGTVLVVREGRSRRGDAAAAARRLAESGGRLLGVVVNGSSAPVPGANWPDDDPRRIDEKRLEASGIYIEL